MPAPDYKLRKRPLGAKLAGGVTLTSRIPQIIVELDAAAAMGARAIAEDIAEDARKRAPDATPLGRGLKFSIDTLTRPEGTWVVADTDYAMFVEYGSNLMAPHPFLIPALEAQRQQAIATMQHNITNVIQGRGLPEPSAASAAPRSLVTRPGAALAAGVT